MASKQKIILSASNDLFSDQRLAKVCDSLRKNGYEVELLGRKLSNALKLDRSYPTKRFKLWFNKGPLFYANLNLRLFFYLLFKEFDKLIANDLDTLLANYWVAKLKGKPLIYDSHEYFTEVPELIHRPKVQAFWKAIERRILPQLKATYTVSTLVAEAYRNQYGLQMEIVRNFPRLSDRNSSNEAQKERAVIYQGALNVGRGLEELINAFAEEELKSVRLWIFGSGDIEENLKAQSKLLGLENRVLFFGRLAPEELRTYTSKALLGVSIEKMEGKNYEYALPNKVFDYLHAGIPILYSQMKEVVELLHPYQVGEVLRSYEPKLMARQIANMIEADNYRSWIMNTKQAAETYCWEKEEKVLLKVVENAI